MDITSVQSVEDYEFTLFMPDGAKTDIVFKIRSLDCAQAKRVRDKWDAVVAKSKKGRLSAEQKDQYALNMIKVCVYDWSNMLLDGQPFEYSQENMETLLTDKRLKWLVDILADELMDKNNFLSYSESN